MDNNIVFYAAYGIHMLGIAALLHGFFSQMSKDTKGIHVTMIYGALTQLVTGVIMFASASDEDPINSTWVAVKFSVAAAILVVSLLGKKTKGATKNYWLIVGVLTMFNLVFAFAADLFN